MAPLIATALYNTPLAQFIGAVATLSVAYVALRRLSRVEEPAGRAAAAREEAAAAVEMLRAQREFTAGVTEQLKEAQRQALNAQTAATAAKLSAEEAKQQLAEAMTRAAEREHTLVNERLIAVARIAVLERTVESQALRISGQGDKIQSLEAQLGLIERRKP